MERAPGNVIALALIANLAYWFRPELALLAVYVYVTH